MARTDPLFVQVAPPHPPLPNQKAISRGFTGWMQLKLLTLIESPIFHGKYAKVGVMWSWGKI